ncbi:hypothetical protein A8144_00015 [Mycobacterium leprae 3125609]|nr:hypothetical protein A8144_00015 [Mycobacterium leprae 3125609]OAX72193.1 hypothetical protein A3216_00070 [Mycobacterium leprae 7935681]
MHFDPANSGYVDALITEQEFCVNLALVLLSNKLIRYSNVGENTLLTSWPSSIVLTGRKDHAWCGYVYE